MPDPATYRPAPGSIPEAPGVYRFSDAHGRVIYVGKAKSLRQRLNSYFADLAGLHPRTRQMVTTAAHVQWTVVTTEVEALQLEYNWIKEFDPRFNVRYRDDKTYPVLAVTMNEEFPRLHVYRGPRRKGVRYFGPFAHAWAIRETLDLLLRVFPARTCSAGVFKRHGQIGRPCLLGYIDKCSAPCVGRVDAAEHRRIVEDFCDFLAGRTDHLIRQLERRMAKASEELEFEKAARLRDDVGALRRAMERQAVVLGGGTDADVVAFADDELEAAVQVFHVRGGRVRGQRGWVIDKVEPTDTANLVERFLTQFYGEQAALAEASDDAHQPVPKEIIVPELPAEVASLAEWLSGLRGSRVSVRVAQRGDKRALAETVARNAAEALTQHKLRRAGDLTARSAALAEIQDALGLDSAPLRIECIDVSHVQGTNVVASLVVFEDGLARKSEYRRFEVRDGAAGGDVASIAEVVRRRFRRYLAETGAETGRTNPGTNGARPVTDRDPARGNVGSAAIEGSGDAPDLDTNALPHHRPGIDPETGRPRKFAYPPNLLVVDGGQPQVEAASDVLAELGVTDVAVCGLAKRLEEVWLPAEPDPVILSRTSEGLYLLQRVRDEAHRFAIAYHRQRRSAGMTVSELDAVPGLGPARRAALLKHFGSVRKLKAASADEIAAVPGFGPSMAAAVVTALGGGTSGMTVSEERPGIDVALISGLSGAGRSTAAKVLEDLGWFVVDNLPPALITTMVDLGARARGEITRIAVVMDVRSRAFTTDLAAVIKDLDGRGYPPRLLFLEASDAVLVRRFEQVRRSHPLQGDGRLVDGINRERELLRPLREAADLVVDTSTTTVPTLRATLERTFGADYEHRMRATIVSFGYKYGLPMDSDVVVDVRFLPNPFWIPELRDKTGRDEPVRDYVLSQEGCAEFIDRYLELLGLVGAGYRREGKHYITVSIGCTGGKHRSVAISEEIARRLSDNTGMTVGVAHRDLGRE